jgi:glycosyltransferase involved in cell wall biosynthesis
MIDMTNKASGRILDALATRRILRKAAAILYLTPTEKGDIGAVAGNQELKMIFLPNGVPTRTDTTPNDPAYISFISRFQVRKHPENFVSMAKILLDTEESFEFRMAGSDEGQLSAVKEQIDADSLSNSVQYLGPLDHAGVLNLLNQTWVLVLPSVDEPFPMIVLEAMSSGVPVVVTNSCGLAPYITDGSAGIVSIGDPVDLASCVTKILQDYGTYQDNASKLASESFSMTKTTQTLVQIYRNYMRPTFNLNGDSSSLDNQEIQ